MKLFLSGMVQWLVYSCLVCGEDTITTALNGGDVKHGFYLHNLCLKQSCKQNSINKLCATKSDQYNYMCARAVPLRLY